MEKTYTITEEKLKKIYNDHNLDVEYGGNFDEFLSQYSLPVSPNVSKVEDWDSFSVLLKDFCDKNNYTDKPLFTVMPFIIDYIKQRYSLPVSQTEPDGWVCNNVFVPIRSHFNDWQFDNAQPVYFTPMDKQISEVEAVEFAEWIRTSWLPESGSQANLADNWFSVIDSEIIYKTTAELFTIYKNRK